MYKCKLKFTNNFIFNLTRYLTMQSKFIIDLYNLLENKLKCQHFKLNINSSEIKYCSLYTYMNTK